MKRLLITALMLGLIGTAACSQGEKTTGAPAAESTSEAEETVLIRVNTDGLGEIAVAEDGGVPEFDEEFPMSSAFTHVKKGSAFALSARGQEDYQFIKWTKDGEYYSGEADIAPVAEADAEYIAVFGMSNGFDGPAVTDIGDAKTMADILALPYHAQSTRENCFACVFELDGVMYRAVSFISPETAEQIFSLDFDDPEYEEKWSGIIAPLPIDRMDALMDLVPPQEELDAYAGKTAGELLDEGWMFSWFNAEDKEAGLEHGLFTYKVSLEGEVKTGEEFDEDSIRPLTVTKVTYDGLGDITADLEEG